MAANDRERAEKFKANRQSLWPVSGACSGPTWQSQRANYAANYMTDQHKIVVVLSTCPVDSAARIAHTLVNEGLAACVNQLPGVTSTYRWQGQVHSDQEALLIMKTAAERFEALKARILELHPYELPEVIALPVCGAFERYAEWVQHTVRPMA